MRPLRFTEHLGTFMLLPRSRHSGNVPVCSVPAQPA